MFEQLSVNRDDVETYLGGKSFEEAMKEYDEEGYLIFNNVLSEGYLSEIRDAAKPYLDKNIAGRNDFEGLNSNRLYALVAKSPVFAKLSMHPLALAFAEADLGRNCLLYAYLAINLHPGESVQPWHYDDSHCNAKLPRKNWSVSTFWAIDDTTDSNGATEIIPGSHLWGEEDMNGAINEGTFADTRQKSEGEDPGARMDAIKATMPAGSFMVAKGTLWHRGGANKSEGNRFIITPQYCEGWVRSLENFSLSVPRDIAAKCPERVQELIGYDIYPPFKGYVDGMHPKKALAGFETK